jgi:hypothetical protein
MHSRRHLPTMPSTETDWMTASTVSAVLVAAYATVGAGRPLFGVFLAAVLYTVAWLLDRLSPATPVAAFGRTRALFTGGGVVLVVGYSLVIAQEFLLGVIVAATLVVSAWVTSPYGPVAARLD